MARRGRWPGSPLCGSRLPRPAGSRLPQQALPSPIPLSKPFVGVGRSLQTGGEPQCACGGAAAAGGGGGRAAPASSPQPRTPLALQCTRLHTATQLQKGLAQGLTWPRAVQQADGSRQPSGRLGFSGPSSPSLEPTAAGLLNTALLLCYITILYSCPTLLLLLLLLQSWEATCLCRVEGGCVHFNMHAHFASRHAGCPAC